MRRVLNETLYLFLLLTGFIAFYKGAQAPLKIVAGHIPVAGLRDTMAQ